MGRVQAPKRFGLPTSLRNEPVSTQRSEPESDAAEEVPLESSVREPWPKVTVVDKTMLVGEPPQFRTVGRSVRDDEGEVQHEWDPFL